MKHTLKTLTVAAALVLPALAGCSRENQPANRPADAPTGDQPQIIDKPVAPTKTPDAKPKEEKAPKGT